MLTIVGAPPRRARRAGARPARDRGLDPAGRLAWPRGALRRRRPPQAAARGRGRGGRRWRSPAGAGGAPPVPLARERPARAIAPVARDRRRRRGRRWLLCAAWFAAKGALCDLHDVLFVFTPYYTGLGWQSASAHRDGLVGLHRVAHHVLRRAHRRAAAAARVRDRRASERPAVVAAARRSSRIHLVGVVMQGKFFPYHYGATWPAHRAARVARPLARSGRCAARCGGRGAFAFGLLPRRRFRSPATKDVRGSFLIGCPRAHRGLHRAAPAMWPARQPGLGGRRATRVANRAWPPSLRARAPARSAGLRVGLRARHLRAGRPPRRRRASSTTSRSASPGPRARCAAA